MVEAQPFNALGPVKHPITGTEYIPAAPRMPTFFEQREMTYRQVAAFEAARLGRRGIDSAIFNSDEYHGGVMDDEIDTRRYGNDV